MNDTFTAVYGHDRSWARRIFYPVISPRPKLRAIRLLAMFPVGIAYFVVALVTAFAVGGVDSPRCGAVAALCLERTLP